MFSWSLGLLMVPGACSLWLSSMTFIVLCFPDPFHMVLQAIFDWSLCINTWWYFPSFGMVMKGFIVHLCCIRLVIYKTCFEVACWLDSLMILVHLFFLVYNCWPNMFLHVISRKILYEHWGWPQDKHCLRYGGITCSFCYFLDLQYIYKWLNKKIW